MRDSLKFLLSADWWRASTAFVGPLCPRFVLPSALMAFSNIGALFCDTAVRGGLNSSLLQNGELDLQKTFCLCISLLLAGIIATVAGIIACSIWLLELTALARVYFSAGAGNMPECFAELKGQARYLGTVWLLGSLYLLGPVLPASTLLAFSIMGSMSFSGEPLLAMPPLMLVGSNLLAALFFLLALDYSIILTALSSTLLLKPKATASLAADLLIKHFPEITALNCFLIFLQIGVSAPFSLAACLPPLAPLSRNLAFQIGCQVWYAFACLVTWPLCLLTFAEFLKPVVGNLKAKSEA
jgi:hypothetical protein